MFSEDDAGRWSDALVLMGYASWASKNGPTSWAVWVENAGLLFCSEQEIKGWLRQRWLRESMAGEVLNG